MADASPVITMVMAFRMAPVDWQVRSRVVPPAVFDPSRIIFFVVLISVHAMAALFNPMKQAPDGPLFPSEGYCSVIVGVMPVYGCNVTVYGDGVQATPTPLPPVSGSVISLVIEKV